MKRAVIIDTGPLVALLNRREQHHAWTAEQFRLIQPPMMTCEAVISEASFLLQRMSHGVDSLLELQTRGVIVVPFQLSEDVAGIAKLLTRYRNLPMSFADACLVRMSEQYNHSTVLTLDQHFKQYRKNGRLVIPTLMPE